MESRIFSPIYKWFGRNDNTLRCIEDRDVLRHRKHVLDWLWLENPFEWNAIHELVSLEAYLPDEANRTTVSPQCKRTLDSRDRIYLFWRYEHKTCFYLK